MKQESIFGNNNNVDDRISLGPNLYLKILGKFPRTYGLISNGVVIKKTLASDKVAFKIFVTEAVELGANQSRLSEVLDISRQTIHNYLEIRKHFGLEGLIHGYTLSDGANKKTQRKLHREEGVSGNKAKIVAEIRKEKKDEQEEKKRQINFTFEETDSARKVDIGEQPFVEEHDWESTRYAGVFAYLITLISGWKWLHLIMGHFGSFYKIFLVFVLMGARNIRSIEQLKNERNREAGLILGLSQLPSLPKIWEWFYNAAHIRISNQLLFDYFRYQLRAGLVCIWLWFVDGHLLPYSGQSSIRYSYNTQRRLAVPGRTNYVTCDGSGRIVWFEIQEGKGDLRGHIISMYKKWSEYVPGSPVMVFDREGNGINFYYQMIIERIPFVTWEKNTDAAKLAELPEDKFTQEFELNDKKYSVFEEDKEFTFIPEDQEAEKQTFTLRRIYIWNRSSKKRTCGLAWSGDKYLGVEDCALAILNRWGASENTFKHMNERHPLHYHPGFELSESENQEISNPEIKIKKAEIQKIDNKLKKLYKKLSTTEEVLNKDGTPRQNSVKEQTKQSIKELEGELAFIRHEKSQLPEKVSVSDLQNYKSIKKIDNEGKNLFDFVTCSVWNARKQMVDWLRPIYNKENELVDLFYAITDSHGWVKCTRYEVKVRLEPLQQPKRRSAQEFLCRKLTNLGVQLPNGKWLVLEVGDSPI
jgi:hypothetical protein